MRPLRELHVKRSATDLRPGEAKRIGRTGREPISRTGEVKSSSGRAAMSVAAKTFFVRNLEISPHSHSIYSNYYASPTEPNIQDPPRSPNLRPRRPPGGPVSDQSRFYVSKVPVKEIERCREAKRMAEWDGQLRAAKRYASLNNART